MNKSLIWGTVLLLSVLLVGLVGSGVFAQNPTPTPGAVPLTATQIIINATNRVLTPFTMASMPPDLTHLPGVDPLTMHLANDATQFAVEQEENPTPGAKIPGCVSGSNIFSNNFEVQNQFQAAFIEAELPVLVYVSQIHTTADCVNYVDSLHSITLRLAEEYSQSTEFITSITETIQVFLSQNTEFVYVKLSVGPESDPLGRTIYALSLSATYNDLVANNQNGLQGLDLFIPRSG